MPESPSDLEALTSELATETSVPALLARTARLLTELLRAPACTISRVIGDVLVDLAHHWASGHQDRLGHGYLISDYPLTREVIERREPRTVFLGEDDADATESALLRELGFGSLLMIALECDASAWGLVEVYGAPGRRFEPEDVEVGRVVVAATGSALGRLEQRG